MRVPGTLLAELPLTAVATRRPSRRIPPLSYRQVVLRDKPSGYWPLIESSGTTAVDLVAGRNGTYTGGYSLAAGTLASSLGSVVTLDGTDDYIEIADDTLWSTPGFTGRLAVEAWIKPTAVNRAAQFIAAKHQEWQLRIESDGTILWDVNYNGIKSVMSCTSPSALTAGTIYHVVATYNRVTPKAELFINGVSVASDSNIDYSYDPADTSNLLRIGARSDNGGNEFIGSIGHVAIYPRPLTATEVALHYRAGSQALTT